ncbi:YitT family protein [Zobellia uliginosa]|uniref:YitT family protein n=1 Tax=Zobellia uliginosa TaxID=143224 RepID=UPI001C069898|nr:YitT family protein [Zobellia uliginosa]MBU2947475.1 YitT family protein [Zobellia uliginosa]
MNSILQYILAHRAKTKFKVDMGIAPRGQSVIDSTNVLAIYLNRNWHLTIGDVLLLIHLAIFSGGAHLLGIETALYTILTYLAADKTVNYVVNNGLEEHIGMTIISPQDKEIRIMLSQQIARVCAIYK